MSRADILAYAELSHRPPPLFPPRVERTAEAVPTERSAQLFEAPTLTRSALTAWSDPRTWTW